jgi:GntR family transcriptional regulator, transcriptional repressor for pyruvate dehydrogenase complex
MKEKKTNAIQVKPIKKRSVPEEVIHQLRIVIESGQIKPGGKLPPERELSRMLNVSRPSLREALRALNLLGILENRVGSGTYLSTPSDKWTLEPFNLLFTLSKERLNDIFEVRKSLEGTVAGLAAERRSDEDLEDIKNKLNLMEDSLEDDVEYAKKEVEFHRAIIEASKNLIIADMMERLYSLLQETRTQFSTHFRNTLILRTQDYLKHQEIFTHIMASNKEKATQAMIEHLSEFQNAIFSEES